MSSLVWIGFLAFFVVSLVVGVRLLLLWSRTRELPELLIGIGVLGIGPVGFGAMMAASVVEGSSPGAAAALYLAASLTVSVGVFCKCLFNWRVYHLQSRVCAAITGAVGLFLAGVLVHRLLGPGFRPVSPPDGLGLAQSATQVGCLLWGAGEALRYWLMMRRRARLGLADPVVTNRFLMWGVGAGAAGLGSAVGTVWSLVSGVATLETPWVVASSSAHGFVAAVALSLAFVPPAAYRRWLERRAGGAPA
ncbi:MAG: hypothetical protein ACQGVK_21535 [Myxococcota bacterium]